MGSPRVKYDWATFIWFKSQNTWKVECESLSLTLSRSHSSPTMMWTFISYLSPFTRRSQLSHIYIFFFPYSFIYTWHVLPWHGCIFMSLIRPLLIGIVFSFCCCWKCCREYWDLFTLFQDERALPKGDFFPPERPQQLPRKCLNYYGYNFEFDIF